VYCTCPHIKLNGLPNRGISRVILKFMSIDNNSFLLELGTEELPAQFIPSALEQWRVLVPKTLAENFLTYTSLEFLGTPRRLALLIHGLAQGQPDREEEVKGPPADRAFDPAGKPTQAAAGFARTRGIAPEALYVKETPKGPFVHALVKTSGRPAAEILQELVPAWITKLEGKRLMRWADGDLKFSRPIRWLVVLLNDQVLPIALEGLVSGQVSSGHRILAPQTLEIPSAQGYKELMEQVFVQVDPVKRQETIRTLVQQEAQKLGGTAQITRELLEEVTYLVEWPSAVVGAFDPEFLELPAPVIVQEMTSHQRYFPVFAGSLSGTTALEKLLPKFIAISNGDSHYTDLIAQGNQRVLRARLSDGRFFYKEDRKQPLEALVPKLDAVTYQQDLGSLGERIRRLEPLTRLVLAQGKSLPEALCIRTAQMAKADLVSQMVYEFPELQGIIGSYYAQADGEDPQVAQGIRDHYKPLNAEDNPGNSLTGKIVGIADRLELLVGIFGLGLVPTGSSDPFALRRACQGLLQIAWELPFRLNLVALLQQAIQLFQEQNLLKVPAKELLDQLLDFCLARAHALLKESQGVDYDLLDAVLGKHDRAYGLTALTDVQDLRTRALLLQKLRQDGTLGRIYETVNRVARLAQQGDLPLGQRTAEKVVDPGLFESPAEEHLLRETKAITAAAIEAKNQGAYPVLVQALENAVPAVTEFFDAVLVMAPEETLKRNRLNLLGVLRNNYRVLADFSALVIAGE
jgi:glycyl-tRNA synthetase beta chain